MSTGVCAYAEQCPDVDRHSGLAPATQRNLCSRCEREASRDVQLLPFDYVDLSQFLPRRPVRPDTKTARPVPQSTPPIDLHIERLRSDIAWALQVWELPVREAAELAPAIHEAVREGHLVQKAVEIIAPRVDLLAGLPAVAGYARGLDAGPVEVTGLEGLDQLRALHRRARRMLGVGRLVMSLPGDCSECGAWALRRRDGTDTVYCAQCRCRWSYTEYTRYVGLMIVNPGEVRAPTKKAA
jgi:hypothetical protein